jgi:hypothetical protein
VYQGMAVFTTCWEHHSRDCLLHGSLPGAGRRACCETPSPLSARNVWCLMLSMCCALCRIPGWFLWPLATCTAFYFAFGPAAAAMYAAAGFGSVFFLEVINYVEHYGLRRRILADGKPERVSVGHSWNANHMLSNAVLLRLQRHTDHHMHASRPYYELESVEGAPKLPACYSAMIVLALVPPLWFCVMNPRVHMHQVLQDVQAGPVEAVTATLAA